MDTWRMIWKINFIFYLLIYIWFAILCMYVFAIILIRSAFITTLTVIFVIVIVTLIINVTLRLLICTLFYVFNQYLILNLRGSFRVSSTVLHFLFFPFNIILIIAVWISMDIPMTRIMLVFYYYSWFSFWMRDP